MPVSNCHSNIKDCKYLAHPHMHVGDMIRKDGDTFVSYTVRFLPVKKER